MVQINEPDLEITIVIKCYDSLPDDSRYLAYIENYNDAKCISPVSAKTIGECVKQLGISLECLEGYRKQKGL